METEYKPWEVVILDDLREDLLPKVVDFLNTFLADGMDPIWSTEHFQWKLQQNPAGRGFLACAISGDEVVGTASITPKRIWYKNQVIVAGETGDTYSHPEFRKKKETKVVPSKDASSPPSKSGYLQKSIFGRLVHENTTRALKSGIQIIYGTPNENSRPGYEKRLNYKSHPLWEVTFHRPTILGIGYIKKLDFLFKALPIKQLVMKMSIMERLLDSTCFKFWEYKRKKLGYFIEKIDQATADLDQLWGRLKFQYEFCMVRDQTYFQHRFFDNPLAEYDVYKATHQVELCGVIVSRIRQLKNRSKVCFIADWFLDESKEYLFDIMLAHVIHDQYAKGIHVFSAWASETSAHTSTFHKLGFVSSSKIPIIFYKSDEGRELIETCSSLDFTIASSDNI